MDQPRQQPIPFATIRDLRESATLKQARLRATEKLRRYLAEERHQTTRTAA